MTERQRERQTVRQAERRESGNRSLAVFVFTNVNYSFHSDIKRVRVNFNPYPLSITPKMYQIN